MSDDSTLIADLDANEALAKSLNVVSTVGDVVAHIQHVLWPYLRSLVEETLDIDATVHDLVHETDDVLHPETAKIFAGLVVGVEGLVSHFLPTIDKAKDPKIHAGLVQLRALARKAAEILEEITMPEVDEDEDDDIEEGDDDGSDDDAGDGDDASDDDGDEGEEDDAKEGG